MARRRDGGGAWSDSPARRSQGLGWAEVTALPEPISTTMGIAWLTAAVLVLAAGGLLAVRALWWWVAGAVGVVVSQAVIVTSWRDAKAGTVANVVLLVAAGCTFASQGPTSYRAEYTPPTRRGRTPISSSTSTTSPTTPRRPRAPSDPAQDHRNIGAGKNCS